MTDVNNNRWQREVMQSLGRIEQKVDDLKDRQNDDRSYSRLNSKRIGVLERAESRRKGVTATIATVVSALIALVVAVLKDVLSGG